MGKLERQEGMMDIERLPSSPISDSTGIDGEPESPVNTVAGLAGSAGAATMESGRSLIEPSVEPPPPGGTPARVSENQIQADLVQNRLVAHLPAAEPSGTELSGAAVSGPTAPLSETDASGQLARISTLLTGLSDQLAAAVEAGGEVETYLEEQLASVGDDAHLAKTDLQGALHKQQQLIQVLSNVSKLLSDYALSTIRKIG